MSEDEHEDPVADQWHVVTCPGCRGKREKYVAYEEEYHSGYEKCYSCNGKGLVKVKINDLEEYRP